MDGMEARLPDLPVTTAYHYTETTPVLFWHYWPQRKPVISAGHAACLDYSVAKNGFSHGVSLVRRDHSFAG
jgi:hypothetical protein